MYKMYSVDFPCDQITLNLFGWQSFVSLAGGMDSVGCCPLVVIVTDVIYRFW